jgi:hypothetical protein
MSSTQLAPFRRDEEPDRLPAKLMWDKTRAAEEAEPTPAMVRKQMPAKTKY